MVRTQPASVDQFNLMTYGDDLATLQADVAATIRQGLPASKFVVGIDIIGGPRPPLVVAVSCRGRGRLRDLPQTPRLFPGETPAAGTFVTRFAVL